MTAQPNDGQEKFIRANIVELREEIAVGMAQIQHGETIDGKTAIQNLRQKLRNSSRRSRPA
jgi:hypothetical protein